jgi:hypothetical protein
LMGLNCQISMKLARKMVVPRHECRGVSALLLSLSFKLMSPSKKELSPYPKRIPRNMPSCITSRRFEEWRRIMGHNNPNLLASLRRLTLMGVTQRACWIPSLNRMRLLSKVVYHPQKLRDLRSIFQGLYADAASSGHSFAIEINSNGSNILVLIVCPIAGKVMLTVELHDRLGGLIGVLDEQQIIIDSAKLKFTIDLIIVNSGSMINSSLKQIAARFFYAGKVSIPLSSTKQYDLGAYNSVRFYQKSD